MLLKCCKCKSYFKSSYSPFICDNCGSELDLKAPDAYPQKKHEMYINDSLFPIVMIFLFIFLVVNSGIENYGAVEKIEVY